MTTYLPPTEDLPNFNPSVFQNGSTEGITIGEADTRYVKKSGSIMSGALSTPSLLVNSIDVETQLDKIPTLETKTTNITFAGSTTTISNTLDITGTLSTPNITNVDNAIDTLETKTTNITFAGSTTTISNTLDITGVISIPNVGNVENAIDTLETKNTDITFVPASTGVLAKTTVANNFAVGEILSTENIDDVEDAIQRLETKTIDIGFIGGTQTTTIDNNLDIAGTLSTPNITDINAEIISLQTNLSGITYDDATNKTTITNNLDVTGVISTPSITNLQTSILANEAKFGVLGSAHIYWQNSVENGNWGGDNRLDAFETAYEKVGDITISENTTRDGAADLTAGTYRIKVVANIRPRQSGSITITPDRIDFLIYLSVDDADVATPTLDTPSSSGYIRQLNNNNQGYGNNLSFEKIIYFNSTTELSIKTQLYSNSNRSYTGTIPENNLSVDCLMVVEKISASEIINSINWGE